jgi:3-deoxy-manno-octulosonate cytidylyltransferase (CMP-KDO synthetase)
MRYVIVIPARYQSSRFPGKPLTVIRGQSLIYRVWSQCIQAAPHNLVYVATDNDLIYEHCQLHNIQVVMTSDQCLTGTDRLCEFSEKIDADCYINVQGDEPLISPEIIKNIIHTAANHPAQVINAYCPIYAEEDYFNLAIPKVVFRPDGRLLYMSRAPIPGNKTMKFEGEAYKQVCVYAFPKNALTLFGKTGAKTRFENLEDIEILRFLELGYEVQMIEVPAGPVAVDVPADVFRVEAILENHVESSSKIESKDLVEF